MSYYDGIDEVLASCSVTKDVCVKSMDVSDGTYVHPDLRTPSTRVTSVSSSVENHFLKTSLTRLKPFVQHYQWGMQGESSLVARLAKAG